MAEQSGGEKTLPASPKKKQQAREKGNVAKSQDLSAGITLLMAFLALWALGPAVFGRLIASTHYYFSEMDSLIARPIDMQVMAVHALMSIAPAILPVMVLLAAAGIAINVAQFGFLFSAQALRLKFERLNPITGAQRFVSLRMLVEFVKSLSKLGIAGTIVWLSVRGRFEELLSLTHMGPVEGAMIAWNMVLTVWWRVALAMIVIGLFDYAFQRWQHERDLMMTQQEARQELKEMEGDPKIKQRIRAIQRQMAMQRMIAEVPEAEVVITNPTTYAVALRYNGAEMTVPVVVAKGARLLAERIRTIAIENDVPIIERPELARALYRTVEIGQPVTEDVFRAVAEVLAYVYQIDRRQHKLKERAQAADVAPAMA